MVNKYIKRTGGAGVKKPLKDRAKSRTISLTDDEYAKLRALAKVEGFDNLSPFFRYLIDTYRTNGVHADYKSSEGRTKRDEGGVA